MKGLPNEKSSVLFNDFEAYQIVGYRNENYEHKKDTKYFILDDNFHIHAISKSRLSLLENDNTKFVQVLETNHIQLYMDKNFELIFQKSLLKNENLDFNCEIWDRVWLAYSLDKKGEKLNKELQFALSDESHKLNYIHGLLDFATDFMNFETLGYEVYDISFSKININKSRLRFEKEYFEKIESKNTEEIIDLIETFLFKRRKITNYNSGSYITSRKIFLLIESIIISESYLVYSYYDGYKSSKIIFEHLDNYFILNLDESD